MTRLLAGILLPCFVSLASAAETKRLKLLFLGDNGHHRPKARFDQLQPVFANRNITMTYADTADVLDAEKLKPYDGIIIFSNLERITPEQEKALLDYVASGKGFIPLHCASYCFLKDRNGAVTAYGKLDAQGKQFLKYVCSRNAITVP